VYEWDGQLRELAAAAPDKSVHNPIEGVVSMRLEGFSIPALYLWQRRAAR
jgi:hypothetical protein